MRYGFSPKIKYYDLESPVNSSSKEHCSEEFNSCVKGLMKLDQ